MPLLHTLTFSSYSEWLGAVQETASSLPKGNDIVHPGHMGDAWFGGLTWKQSMDMARKGWPEAEALIERYSGTLFQSVSKFMMKPEPIYGYEGLDFDIGRMLDGEPEHWLDFQESEDSISAGNKVVRILYNRVVSCGIDSAALQAKGAVIAALIRLLDYAGFRTELTIGCCYQYDDNTAYTTVPVKSAGQDLDMGLVGYVIAHTAACRRLLFATEFMRPLDVQRKLGEGRETGTLSNYPRDFPQDVTANYDLYLPMSHYNETRWHNVDTAQKWIMDHLRKLGVVLQDEKA
jgi:hypothetical protein